MYIILLIQMRAVLWMSKIYAELLMSLCMCVCVCVEVVGVEVCDVTGESYFYNIQCLCCDFIVESCFYITQCVCNVML